MDEGTPPKVNGVEHADDLNGNHEFLHKDLRPDLAMNKIKTAGSISISPDLFEKLYLSPQNQVKGDLRKTFGNPTPIGLLGFVLSLGPLSCDLMGWRGAGGSGAASIPAYIFFGGMLMTLGGLLEFFLGNTFPCIVFVAFGAFYLSFGSTLLPQFNAYAAYAPADAASPAAGLETQGFNASFGFFTLSMMLLCVIFLVCSVRTNIAFVIIFISLSMTFGFVTGAYWALASDYAGNAGFASRMLVGAGACAFTATAVGWWIFLSILLASVDFPIALPVGDLSTTIRGASDRRGGEA
ncbi:GPR1/FUN34/YaaH-class plasma membrane protein [Biscogniauxia sp. FL1348]|nr:GPR1/FUN34/YaaH-class plasma membrane protein [Biscogniauxia sp. FL1348]